MNDNKKKSYNGDSKWLSDSGILAKIFLEPLCIDFDKKKSMKANIIKMPIFHKVKYDSEGYWWSKRHLLSKLFNIENFIFVHSSEWKRIQRVHKQKYVARQ